MAYYCPWCWSELQIKSNKFPVIDSESGVVTMQEELIELRCGRHGVLYLTVPDELARMIAGGIVRTSVPSWIEK